MHTLGVMSSGYPETLEYIQAAIENGALENAKIGVVVIDQKETPIAEAAARLGVPHFVVTKREYGSVDIGARDIFRRYKAEIIVLTGYKKKVGPVLLEAFPERILNIHPGPIPRFGGKGMIAIAVQEAVLAAGAKYTGPTVHIVDEEYDTGPILAYCPIKVRAGDTAESLRERCQKAGRPLYVQVIRDFLYRLDYPEDF